MKNKQKFKPEPDGWLCPVCKARNPSKKFIQSHIEVLHGE
jgi:rubredoxin